MSWPSVSWPVAGRSAVGRAASADSAAASAAVTVRMLPSSPRTPRPSCSTRSSHRAWARQWKPSSHEERQSGLYAAGTEATEPVSSSADRAGLPSSSAARSKPVPGGSDSSSRPMPVIRLSWRRVVASSRRTSTGTAVGRLLKSLGQTSRTLSHGLPGSRCSVYGSGSTSRPASAAAVSCSART
ncbi:hypothetical protein ACFQ0M_19030 [Kitasatospora aburaviensis]